MSPLPKPSTEVPSTTALQPLATITGSAVCSSQAESGITGLGLEVAQRESLRDLQIRVGTPDGLSTFRRPSWHEPCTLPATPVRRQVLGCVSCSGIDEFHLWGYDYGRVGQGRACPQQYGTRLGLQRVRTQTHVRISKAKLQTDADIQAWQRKYATAQPSKRWSAGLEPHVFSRMTEPQTSRESSHKALKVPSPET